MKYKLRYTTDQAVLVRKVIKDQLAGMSRASEAKVRIGEIELDRKLKKEEISELRLKTCCLWNSFDRRPAE